MAEEEKSKRLSKKVFGSTFHPIVENEILGRMRKGETQKEQYDRHKKIKENYFKKGVKPSEIAKLDKEFDRRYEKSLKNERLTKKSQNSKLLGSGYTKKQQSAKASDTGSEYKNGGRVIGIAKRGFGRALKRK